MVTAAETLKAMVELNADTKSRRFFEAAVVLVAKVGEVDVRESEKLLLEVANEFPEDEEVLGLIISLAFSAGYKRGEEQTTEKIRIMALQCA